MNAFVLIMIFVVTTIQYPAQLGYLPGIAKLLPEAVSACALILVVACGIRDRVVFVRPAYWLIFGLIATTMICGVLANAVEVGPVIAGMRRFLRPVPLFFIPAVYAFSEQQVRKQLLLLLALCLPQFPIAMYQRLARLAIGGGTGDTTVGTLGGSGWLSVFLICAACVLTAAFLRKRIKAVLFIPLFILMILPTTINETKVTVIIAPLGLLTLFIVGAKRGARLKNAVLASGLLAVFSAIFIPIYDFYASKTRAHEPIVEFFSNKEHVEKYMSPRDVAVGDTDPHLVGRGDALRVSLTEVVRDPTRVAFGLGMGNASQSSLGVKFEGKYFAKYGLFILTTADLLLFELGLIGLGFALVFDFFVYGDSRVVADSDSSVIGVLALGWAGVTAVIVVATFYTHITNSEAISYLFWYFSGVVAARRVQMARQTASPRDAVHTMGLSNRLRPGVALPRLRER